MLFNSRAVSIYRTVADLEVPAKCRTRSLVSNGCLVTI